MKLCVKTTDFFTFLLRHSFFVKTSVFFTGEKLRTFLHSLTSFFVKTSVLFTGEKLRTFLHSLTSFFVKTSVLFYGGKTTVFFTL